MRKLVLLLGLILAVSFTAAAQDAPKAEVMTGYSFVRTDSSLGSVTAHGFNGSISFNPANAIGVVADFGYYRTSGVNLYSYQFGPKFQKRSSSIEPFAHALFGGVR